MLTGEGGLVRSVLFIDCAARRAPLARVARIDEYHRNSGTRRLVGGELPELGECPIVQPSPLLAPGLNPAANVRQVFETYRAPGAFRFINESLRNTVVGVGLKSPLFAGQLPKAALSSLRSPALKAGFPACEFGTDALDIRPGVGPAVAVESQIDNAEIDAKHIGDADFLGVRYIADAGEIPLATHEHQIDLALAVSEQGPLALAADEGNFQPSWQRPDRDGIATAKADNPVVVRLGREAPEGALFFPVDLVTVRHLRDAAHGSLRSQLEHRPRLAVGHLVQIELPELAVSESLCREKIASLIAALKRLAQCAGLALVRLQLDVRYQLHTFKYGDVLKMFNRQKKERRAFLPGLKAEVSSAERG